MKAFLKAFVVLLLVLAVTGGIVAYSIASKGLSTRTNPSMAEETIAMTLRSLATPRSVRNQPNPVEPTAAALEGALEHWADHCAACHANDGSGNTEMGRQLLPAITGHARCTNAGAEGWRVVLDHRERYSAHRHACLGNWNAGGRTRVVGAGSLHSAVAQSNRGRHRADGRLESSKSREVSGSRRSTALSRRYDRSADEPYAGETAS